LTFRPKVDPLSKLMVEHRRMKSGEKLPKSGDRLHHLHKTRIQKLS